MWLAGRRRLYGDNTDWLGIKNQISSKCTTPAEAGKAVCLLCGAGGTARAAAFALTKMGVGKVLIYNRTLSRAETLAAEFGFEAIADFAPLAALGRLDFVVDTLPGSTKFELPPPQAGLLAQFKPGPPRLGRRRHCRRRRRRRRPPPPLPPPTPA